MTTKLTHNHISKLQNLESEINYVRSIFDNRLGEIMKTFERVFDRKVDWYDYTNGDAEISGFITTEMLSDEEFNLDGGFNFSGYVALIDGEEGETEWDFSYSFPTRFFFEDFEEELIEGLEKYKQKEQQKKKLAKLKREEKKKKKEELLAKLSAEEKKILGIK